MKLVFDEQLKHRIIGGLVIVSMAAVFLPAVLKKSNYRMDNHMQVAVRLPPKPALPKVGVPGEKELFEGVKVTQVSLPTENQIPPMPMIAKATPISDMNAMVEELPKTRIAKKEPIKKAIEKTQVALKKQAKTSGRYVVQLASFSQMANAKSLVSQLRQQGFKANYAKSTNKNGAIYKVLVGELKEIHDAQHLQKQLASSLQLHGFVVKAEGMG